MGDTSILPKCPFTPFDSNVLIFVLEKHKALSLTDVHLFCGQEHRVDPNHSLSTFRDKYLTKCHCPGMLSIFLSILSPLQLENLRQNTLQCRGLGPNTV